MMMKYFFCFVHELHFMQENEIFQKAFGNYFLGPTIMNQNVIV